NIEFIFINDGSTDGTKEYLDKIRNAFSNIKVIHQENSGVAHSRNKGVSLAEGKYIYFCDSDDRVLVDGFLKALDILKVQEPEILVCNYLSQQPNSEQDKLYYKRSKIGQMDGV